MVWSPSLLSMLIGTLPMGLPATPVDEARSTEVQPLPHERLDEPIALTGCKPFVVVEWRGTPGVAGTAPSPRAIRVASRVCARAYRAFFPFAASRGLHPSPPIVVRFPVSLIPAQGAVGRAYRNLNDTTWRFAHRRVHRATRGALWGYFYRVVPSVYMLNEVLDDDGEPTSRFALVLSHEIWHAMAYRHQLYDMDRDGAFALDEELAEDFTEALGLGR